MIFSFLFLFLYIQYAGFCRQQNAKAPLPAKTAGLKNKERNEHDGESVLCIEEIFLSSSLVYSIPDFPAGANFCRIFFAAAGGRALPAVFRELNFCKKISRAKHAQPKDGPWKKPLLPQIQFNTKYVKLQELSYIYSIPYFPQNTTAKPQHLPAVHTLIACGHFCLIQFCGRQMHRQPHYSSADKKEAPLSRRLWLQSKNFGLKGLFSSACSMHAFISVASVLKLFFRTVSTSPTLYRPSFR